MGVGEFGGTSTEERDQDYPLSEAPPSARRSDAKITFILPGFTFFVSSMYAGGSIGTGFSQKNSSQPESTYHSGMARSRPLHPLGRGDMAACAAPGLHVLQTSGSGEIPQVFDLVTSRAARPLGVFDRCGIEEGKAASFILFDAPTSTEVLRLNPARLPVVKDGEWSSPWSLRGAAQSAWTVSRE